jgi:hypothetical protein
MRDVILYVVADNPIGESFAAMHSITSTARNEGKPFSAIHNPQQPNPSP